MAISASEVTSERFSLSQQQVRFFNTFGFLHLPGLFPNEIEDITAGFERIFGSSEYEHWEMHSFQNGGDLRLVLTDFIEKDDALRGLLHDSRVLGVVNGLFGGDPYEFAGSDGNVWYCETYWHSDIYGSPLPMYHVKLSFYLDSLRGDSGAIRLIPGSNFYSETFAETLRKDLANHDGIRDLYGIEGHEVPCWTVESDPGDLIVWNQRTIHASYNGSDRRRSFALTFKEPEGDALTGAEDGAGSE